MKDEKTGLTGKQQAFIEHYCGDCNYNATAAAKAANYAPKAKNRDNACSQAGHQNIRNSKIKEAIRVYQAKTAKKIDVTVEFVVEKLLKGLAIAEECNNLAAMARFTELLGRHKAMFTDNVNQTDTQQQRELDEKEKATARRIAAICLEDKKAG